MREILFRAKTQSNEWVEGLLWKKKYNTNKFFISCFPDKDDNEEVFVVRPKTIGQYTGLTDINGKKIFEGDILHSEQYPFVYNGNRNYFVVVVWVKDEGLFGMEYYKYPESKVLGDCIGNFETFSNVDISDYEVIGNIHDNPETLKK